MQELKNPGFEIGIPKDWHTYETGTAQRYTYPEQGRSGGSSVAIEYPIREIGKTAAWIQTVQTDPTKKYKLSGYIKTENIIGIGASIKVDWKDKDGMYLSTSAIMSRQKGTISWKYFEGVVTPNINAAKATIVLDMYDSSGKVLFDNISFEIILPSHPNIFINDTEVNTIKSKIDSNNEPWKTAYDSFINRDLSFALNLANNPPSVVNGGPTPPTGDNHDFYEYQGTDVTRYDYLKAIDVGRAVRTLGLTYALSNNQSDKDNYADKAIKIIKVWCADPATRLYPRFIKCGETFYQSRIDLPITMCGMFYGIDLILDSPKWGGYPGIKDAFKIWVTDLINSPQTTVGTIKVAGATNCDYYKNVTAGCNNICNWRLALIATAGALLDDDTMLNYAFDNWKSLVDYQIDSQGRMIEELKRGKRALFYSTYAINAMTHVAEIARHRNVDLYNYKVSSTDNRGLELALDYHAPYIVNPSSWPNNPGTVQELTDNNAAIYELAYTRISKKTSYRSVINKVGRPIYENRNMGPVTLTHGSTLV